MKLHLALAILSLTKFNCADADGGDSSSTKEWNYSDIDKWGDVNEVCKNGQRQSPIHINGKDATSADVLRDQPLTFSNYDRLYNGMLSNTGKTVVWSINASQPHLPASQRDLKPTISGSGYGASYQLHSVHFHWSGSTCFGSEHVIDYRPAALEAHFVHFNTIYSGLEDAVTHDDGLAVLGFLMTLADPNEQMPADTTDYSVMARKIPFISRAGAKVPAAVSFANMMPAWAMNNVGVYYRYNGSLTTPPCSENVIWTVFERRIPIPQRELNFFRFGVRASAEVGAQTLKFNYRYIQPINDRTVTTNRPPPVAA